MSDRVPEPVTASSAEARLEALAEGLRAWAQRQAAAEERLAAFAFREGGEPVSVGPALSWEALVVRALAVAADPAVVRLLRAVGQDGLPVSRVAASGAFGTVAGDRVAVVAWLGLLASAGLVSRELEADVVAATPLGLAVVGVIDELVSRLGQEGTS